MASLKQTIHKLLDEVDGDFKKHFLGKIIIYDGSEIERWELLDNPALTIIEWQRMREENRPKHVPDYE